MSFLTGLKGCIRAAAGVLYPDKCVCCGEITEDGEDVCGVCRNSLEYINRDKRCIKCGLEKESCVCKARVYHFENIVSVFEYTGMAMHAVRHYKLYRKRHYSEFFIKHMVLLFLNEYRDIKFDAVCSVPTARISRMKHGFDHTAVLRDGIAVHLGLPVLKDVLCCRSFVRSQHGSDFSQRIKNVKGKYYTSKKLSGGTYLLIDDIKTTGATLDECAKQLLIAGADKVYAITALASVYKKNGLKKNEA